MPSNNDTDPSKLKPPFRFLDDREAREQREKAVRRWRGVWPEAERAERAQD